MSDLARFFAGAFFGSCVTLLAMCFAVCVSDTEEEHKKEDKTNGDIQ